MENEFLVVALIFFFASFTQGYSGFAFQLISLSLLTLVWDLKDAIPVCALFGLIINIYLSSKMRQNISLKKVRPLIISAAIGIPIGVYLLNLVNISLIKIALGVVIIIFVIFSIFGSKSKHQIDSIFGYIFGLLSGILGGAMNANGPPILIYLLMRKTEADEFKAMISLFFLFSSVLIVLGHLVSGVTSTNTIYKFATYIIFILLGQTVGSKLYATINLKYYKIFVLVLLSLIGIKLILI